MQPLCGRSSSRSLASAWKSLPDSHDRKRRHCSRGFSGGSNGGNGSCGSYGSGGVRQKTKSILQIARKNFPRNNKNKTKRIAAKPKTNIDPTLPHSTKSRPGKQRTRSSTTKQTQ